VHDTEVPEVVVGFGYSGTDWAWEGIRIRNGADMSLNVSSNEVIAGTAPKATILVSFEVCLDGPPAPLAQW
jgi:hypothetical protein